MGTPFTGCLGETPSGQPTESPTASQEGDTISPTNPECTGAKPVNFLVESVTYDTLGGFDLWTAKDTVTKGDTLQVTFENVTDSNRPSGVEDKYDIQQKGDDGWRSIFWGNDTNSQSEGWHDIQVSHPPGGGFTWELEITRDGLSRDIEEGVGHLAVCTSISPGRYRFVYWGLEAAQDQDDESRRTSIGTPFQITESV